MNKERKTEKRRRSRGKCKTEQEANKISREIDRGDETTNDRRGREKKKRDGDREETTQIVTGK